MIIKKKSIWVGFILLSACLITACTTKPNSVSNRGENMLTNKEKAVALIHAIESGDKSVIGYINAENYKQHNLSVGDGLEGFGEVLSHLPEGSARAKVVRAFEDGDYVFTHTDYNFFGPKVGFDIFRFEDGLIVEHWDNLTIKAEQANPSGRTELDGDTKIVDLDKTEENKEVVRNFINDVLIGGDFNMLAAYIDSEKYLQHNTQIGDGLSGLGAAMEAMAKQGIHMTFTKNHMILGEGNFVLAVSEGSFGGKHTSYYDLFRLEDGRIVEHWDVIENIIPESEWKNTNGKF